MFPEFRDLISKLKLEDAHFNRLFEKHNELDHRALKILKPILSSVPRKKWKTSKKKNSA